MEADAAGLDFFEVLDFDGDDCADATSEPLTRRTSRRADVRKTLVAFDITQNSGRKWLYRPRE
jgi:hypothetical protein